MIYRLGKIAATNIDDVIDRLYATGSCLHSINHKPLAGMVGRRSEN